MKISQRLAWPTTQVVVGMFPTQSPPQSAADPMARRGDASRRALMVALAVFGLCTAASGAYGSGGLVAWGDNFYGEVSGTPVGNFVLVDAGPSITSVAIRSDGSLVSWGHDGWGQISGTPSGNGFVSASAGASRSVAVRSDGSLVVWGLAITGTPAGNDFISVSAGGYNCVALRSDGSLVTWGIDQYGIVSGTPVGNNFVAVSLWGYHCLALRSDGSLVAWGDDSRGQVSGTPVGNNFVSASAGFSYNVALRADGSLVSWGSDENGAVSGTPSGNNFVAVSAGYYQSVALRSDGSLVSWGTDDHGLVSGTPAGNGFTAVSAGYYTSVAITAVVTPEAQIASLSDAVNALVTGGVLLPSQGNSLQTKLSAALDLSTRGNTQGAINKLGDFVKQVSSLIKTGKLTAAQGQPLIDAAQALAAELYASKSLAAQSPPASRPSLPTATVSESFRLYPGTVDPARGNITLRFDLPVQSDVTLEFYDLAGRRIDQVRLGSLGTGRHELSWAPPHKTSGLFFYRLSAGGLTASGKAALVK